MNNINDYAEIEHTKTQEETFKFNKRKEYRETLINKMIKKYDLIKLDSPLKNGCIYYLSKDKNAIYRVDYFTNEIPPIFYFDNDINVIQYNNLPITARKLTINEQLIFSLKF